MRGTPRHAQLVHMDSTAQRHDVAVQWRTERHHNNVRLMVWRHRRRHMKAMQMHATYRMARCHVVGRATQLAKWSVNFKGRFRRQQCKISTCWQFTEYICPDEFLGTSNKDTWHNTHFFIWPTFEGHRSQSSKWHRSLAGFISIWPRTF
jgi:hypothetical protein